MIQLKSFYFNDLRECSYILWDETGESVIVDPGCYTESEQERLVKFIEQNNLKPVKLLNTHGHFDHIMGNAFVTTKWQIPSYIHKEDKHHLLRAKQYTEMFGYKIEQPPVDTIDLEDGANVNFGNSTLRVIHTPGHSKGGVSLVSDDDKFVITGDSLFAGSIGRTDLPGGDYDVLMDSLLNKIVKLGEDYKVYPGHGPATTIGNELATNPFLRYE
jgi:glyoxylase-like metal-dependent hydrolase (beta-lactamase superfamily II)